MTIAPRLLAFLASLLIGLAAFLPLSVAAQNARHVEASMAFETLKPAAGDEVTVAIRMVPETGWHGYWSNPGEAGLPVEARWQAPTGVTFTPLRHPAPHLLDVQGIASYVHEGPFTLLATMRMPEGLARGAKLPVRVALNWLVCSDTLCVPESANLAADLTVGNGAPDTAGAKIVAAAERAMPRPLRGTRYWRDGSDWVFSLPVAQEPSAHLFPIDDGWFDAASAQRSSTEDGRGLIRIKAKGDAPSGSFRGVLANSSGSRSFTADRATPPSDAAAAFAPASAMTSQIGVEASTDTAVATGISFESAQIDTQQVSVEPPKPSAGVSGDVIRIALLGALAGGLLLNLMPCVFPILSLKALSLAKSGASRRAARIEGLGYAGGAIFTALLLGGLLIGLRAIGMEIGWSFQLQSPGVILVLLVLTGTIALNLAGLFELPLPAFAARGGHSGGWIGGFSTGALAAVIAMPCSGPFMAGALGAALVLPAPIALGVFAMLGLGMALPFLAIAFIPAIQRRLPKPGQWMDTLRKVLSIPMFATALALAWLLGRQTGVDGMALGLVVAALFAVSLWWFGLRQRSGVVGWPTLVPAALALVALIAVGIPEAPSATATDDIKRHAGHEPFSEARLAQLRAAGTPVFVDFTADWCLICKVNESVAIHTDATREAFAEAGIVTLTGDWTRQDPAITRFLTQHDRNSIPFYIFYAPGAEPEILPQVLSATILAEKARALPTPLARTDQ